MEPCTHRVFSTHLYTRPLSTGTYAKVLTSQVTNLIPPKNSPNSRSLRRPGHPPRGLLIQATSPRAPCRQNPAQPVETNLEQLPCHPRGTRRCPRVARGSALGGGLPSFSTGSAKLLRAKSGITGPWDRAGGGIPPTPVIGVWPEAEKCMAQRDSHRLLPAQLVMISGRRNGEVDAASTRSREKRPMRGCLRRIPTRVRAWNRSEWQAGPRSLP